MEQAADEGFDCSACQPYVVKPAGERLGWGELRGFGGYMEDVGTHLPVCFYIRSAHADRRDRLG